MDINDMNDDPSIIMLENSAHPYRRLPTAVVTAYCIFGTASAFNINNLSSLPPPPPPPPPSSSSRASPSSRLLSIHSHGSLGNLRRRHHRRPAERLGSNSINDELEIRTVLFASASAYNDNDEATSTIISTTAAALVIDDKNTDANDDESQYNSATSGNNNNSHDVVTEVQSFSTHSSSTTQPQPSTNTNIHHLIAPSIPKILRYTIPAIGIWLCSPVLSMIDTASVGLLSGTAQQAALNPAASVTDCGALVVAFMYTATTNLISAAVRQDEDDDDISEKNDHSATSSALMNTDAQIGKQTTMSRRQPKTTSTLITALKLALLVGTTFAITLMSTGPHLLQLLMGNSASSLDPVVYSAALRYVRIRALGMPAMVVIGTAQSACLGMQDVRSPLYVLLAAAVINFVGDVVLVPLRSPIWGGAAGAAWATVASQYAALLFFARWLTMKKSDDSATTASTTMTTTSTNTQSNETKRKKGGKAWFWKSGGNESIMTTPIAEMSARHDCIDSALPSALSPTKTTTTDITTTNHGGNGGRVGADAKILQPQRRQQIHQKLSSEPSATSQTKIRGFLYSKLNLRTFLSLRNLDKTKVKEFLPFVIPVTTTSIGRISGYIAMSHVAASTLGTYDMAAHQIILSIFCCITPFVDALSQVAQSFVPAVFEAKERNRERANALRKTVNNFRLVGLGFGGVLVSLVACIPLISRYFTTDLVVLERVHSAIAPVGLFMLVNGLMCAGEGTLLGQKDLKFLRNMYAIFFFTVPAYMLRLKHRALTGVQTVGVMTMWSAFSMYNVIRASSFHLRLAQLQRRTDRGVVVIADEPTQKASK